MTTAKKTKTVSKDEAIGELTIKIKFKLGKMADIAQDIDDFLGTVKYDDNYDVSVEGVTTAGTFNFESD